MLVSSSLAVCVPIDRVGCRRRCRHHRRCVSREWGFILSQDVAAADTEELDALEAQCLELSAELKDKESALRQVQELERKCSREYIAYEKAKQKGALAKTAEKKDLRKFG